MRNKQELILDKISQFSQSTPHKIALKFFESDYQNNQELTYQQLNERIHLLANTLVSLNDNQSFTQKPILLIFDSSIHYIASFLSVLRSGNIAVTAYPPRHLRHLNRLLKIIADSKASIILTTSTIKNYCDLQNFQFSKETLFICVDQLNDELRANSENLPIIKPDHIAFLQYTSGSTGMPKGVVVTQKNISANLSLMKRVLGEAGVEKCISWLPIFHDMGLIGNTLLPLYSGGTCVFMAPLTFLKNPFFWLKIISSEQGTYTMAPNFAYDLAINAFKNQDPSQLELNFSNVHCLINGAEPINPETIREFEKNLKPYQLKDGVIKPGYGMAETTLYISCEMSDKRFFMVNNNGLDKGIINRDFKEKFDLQVELVSCGKLDPDYLVKIVDPKTLYTLPVDTIGEIWIQGDSVASGYYQNPEKTKEIFQAFTEDTAEGPFLRTGDLGFIDKNGYITVCGRLKDLIIINGRNIYPQDVEYACFRSDSALVPNCAAAFSFTINGSEECVLVAGVKGNLEETIYQAMMRKVQKEVFEQTDLVLYDILFVPSREVLKTSSGKIQRSACKEAYITNQFKVLARLKDSQPPNFKDNIIEQTLDTNIISWLKEWIARQAKLPIEQVAIDRAFAEYGLTSIQLVTMINDLEKVIGQPLDPWFAWEFPTIEALHQKLTTHNTDKTNKLVGNYEPIAIIGMDCRLPGPDGQDINGINAFWSYLQADNDSIRAIPNDRWDNRLYYDQEITKKGRMYTTGGSFLTNVKQFDTKFFNISPREAEYLDPQQRLTLMTTWHALEDAGIIEDDIKNSQTGVYLGISTHDYDQLIQKQVPLDELSTYQATGTSFATAAGRIAYFLGTQGPCMAIDTACSSSLVSVHQACRALQDGDCQLAIAGGVNLILSPEGNIIFCKSSMLSPKNRCSTFDIEADGYVRGEGCCMIVLKKLKDALQDGNKIHAVIYGSAVNQDGASNGLTAPNLIAQVDVMEKALSLANLRPEQITHLEAHGTGTALGDPIEWEGIRRSYGLERQNPLYITSLKTRIGHLEAAAGIAGLIKTALAVKNSQIPAHLNLKEFNPKLHQQDNMIVPTSLIVWEEENRYAGVSSFGFSGTNAHLILGMPIHSQKSEFKEKTTIRTEHLWVISAKERAVLLQYLQDYCRYAEQKPSLHFPSLCNQSLTQRTHFAHRAFIIAPDQESWLQALRHNRWQEGVISENNQLAWLFTGQGSLMPNIATELYRTIPEFAAIIEKCCAIAQPLLPYDLRAVLLDTPKSIDINYTLYAQPTLFIYEYALAQWFLLLGLKPNILLGHSLGEYVAACIANIITLEDALYLVCNRALLISSLNNNGAMLAINAPLEVVESLITNFDSLVISLKNGPEQIVVSGQDNAIIDCQNYCQHHSIHCKNIATSHAFHSPLMQPIIEQFAKLAAEITYKSAQIPVVSNITGQILKDGQMNAEYWCKHLLQTVEFHQGLHTLVDNGIELCQEIGPKPILITQAQNVHNFITLPSVSAPDNPWPGIMETLGRLYLRGVKINWPILNKHINTKVEDLLNYPFKGKEYWLPDIKIASAEDKWKSYLYHQLWQKISLEPNLINLNDKNIALITNKARKHISHLIACQKLTFITLGSVQNSTLSETLAGQEVKEADWLVYFCQAEQTDLLEETTFLNQMIQQLIQQWPSKPLLFLCDSNSLVGTSLLALLKSVKQEYPQWPIHYLETILLDRETQLQFIGASNPNYWALRYHNGDYYEQQIKPLEPEQLGDSWKISLQTSCLVTGACGDIGQAFIESLTQMGARYIIAVGRKEKESKWSDIIMMQKSQGTQIRYYACDISNSTAVEHLIQNLPADYPPLGIIIHAAGVNHNKPLLKTTDEDIAEILGAKALGAWNLHKATTHCDLKVFNCISSLSAVLGNEGQAIYATANAFLNALSEYRHEQNLPSQTFILGPVKNTGLFKKNEEKLTSYLKVKGVEPLLRTEIQAVFQSQIKEYNLIISHFLQLPNQPPKEEPIYEGNISHNKEVSLTETILTIAEETLRLAPGELSIHDNWFKSGMDSIMASQLAYKINHKYPEAQTSAKDIFNYASVQELAINIKEHISENNVDRLDDKHVYQQMNTLPLSLQQQEIWNFIKNSPTNLAYQIPIELSIIGPLSVERLQKALSEVVKRHDILRCSFHEVLNQAKQHIHKECSLKLEFGEHDSEKEIADFLSALFVLQKPPLIRTRIIRQEKDKYRWLLVFHHLLGDSYTVTSFINEAIAIYEGEILDQEPVKYCDYVSWQWNKIHYNLVNEMGEFWRQRLQEVPVGVALAKETHQPKEACIINHQLSLTDISRSIKALEKNKLSLSNYLLANLFEILLDYFKQDQQGIVVFFSGRESGEFSTVFGDTSNDVLIVAEREQNILTQTQKLQEQILSMHDNQYFRMPIFKEIGLSTPMISFDFQRSPNYSVKSSLEINIVKNSNVQNYLWGDEPRLLSFKVLVKEGNLRLSLKYRHDKIESKLAQGVLEAWANNLLKQEASDLQIATKTMPRLYTASALQQNLWQLLQNHPDGIPYYVLLFKEINTNIDIKHLNKALQQTIDNNPALQVYFVEEKNQLKWDINSAATTVIQTITADDLNTKMGELLLEPIAINQAPLLKIYLIHHANGKKPILLFRFHHLIVDGISAELFAKEFEKNYMNKSEVFVSKEQQIFYLNEHLKEEKFYSQNIADYKTYLAEINQRLKDYHCNKLTENNYLGGVIYQKISKENSAKVIDFCKNHSISPYAFYLHIFGTVLASLSSEREIYISIVKSNRGKLSQTGMIGYFADNLPIILEINPDTINIIQQIKSTQMQILEVIERFSYPILSKDLEKFDYKQPPFIFNQYTLNESENETEALLSSADYLIEGLLKASQNQVSLWNYQNPEKFNLLIRSSVHGDMLGLLYNQQLASAADAGLVLDEFINKLICLLE
ncbi:Polyketide synthase module [Legionella busanensis]|uniref:Polyketide synthase module n=1 Tax=Legionella busanensis TaxID=190655 RepID=A0A378JJZ3_9GAMM|nr:type I polyketide synthase [Legionella busanensis]STX51008.1 Polyketide synthase module [Legionella busanensis]